MVAACRFPPHVFAASSDPSWFESVFKSAEKPVPEESLTWTGWCPVLATSIAATEYEKDLKEPLNGIWDKLVVLRVLPTDQLVEYIAAADLESAIERAHHEHHKLPLVLEDSDSTVATRFLNMRDTTQIDCAALAAAADDTEQSAPLLEDARARIVRAMPTGKTVQFQCHDSALHPVLSTPDGLPTQLWQHSDIMSSECCQPLVREGDLVVGSSDGPSDYAVGQSGVFFIRDSFRVVFTSSLGSFDHMSVCSLTQRVCM